MIQHLLCPARLPQDCIHRSVVLCTALCLACRFGEVGALVDCSRSPDCAALRRQPCSERAAVPNTCGACLPGTWGGDGPMNAVCLSRTACAAIYPGEESCKLAPAGDLSVPFLIPFGRCVCDDGSGRLWPSGPGMCARVFIKFPTGIGLYEVQQCSSRCDAATCTTLATWSPNLTQTSSNTSFPCVAEGVDSVQLMDDCLEMTDQLPASAMCGHVGFTATSTIFDALGDAPVDCELAPSCPASVLETTRLEQSCCFGTHWSLKLDANGEATNETAPGFCQMVAHSSEANGSSNEQFECIVKTAAPGWNGCACLDTRGFNRAGHTCTTACEAPGCNLPPDGIRPVPSAWLSSEVNEELEAAQNAVVRQMCWLTVNLFRRWGPRASLENVRCLGEELRVCHATVMPASSVVITYSWPRSSLLELFIKDDRIYVQFKKLLTIEEQSFRKIRLFEHASVDFVNMLEANAQHLKLDVGQTLFEDKAPNSDAYLLCEGSVAILKDGDLQINIEVGDLADAVLFGEFNVLGLWRAPKATVKATSQCIVKVITMEALQQCFATFPDDSGIFRQLVEDRIEKDASKRIPWTSQEEEASEELQQEFSLLPRSYVRQFVKDYDRIELSTSLAEIPDLKQLPGKPLEELAAVMKLRIYIPQQVILQQGDDLFEIMILQRGTCSAEAFGADLQPIQGPTIIGGIASIMMKKVFTTIVAEETCFVGAISKQRFAATMDKYPDFRRDLLLHTNSSFKRLCDDFQEMSKTSTLPSHLQKINMFSEASSEFISQFAAVMEPCLLLPGQSIVQDALSPKLFVVFDGHLHVMKNGFLVCALPSKSISGVLEVYGIDTGERTQVKTDEICKVGTVAKKAFFSLLEKFPPERVKFEQLLHNLLDNQVGHRLLKHPIFAGMPSQFLTRLSLLFERKVIHPQTVIFGENEDGSTMVVFNVGKADIIFKGLQISMLWPGKSFGGAQMMGVQHQYHATVRTKMMCHVLLLSHEQFCTLTPPGPKRPWVAILRHRTKTAYSQELKLFKQRHMQCRILNQSGVSTTQISSAIYSKMVLLHHILKAWRTLGEEQSRQNSEHGIERKEAGSDDGHLQEGQAQTVKPPLRPLRPLFFSRALRRTRLLIPGKRRVQHSKKGRNSRATYINRFDDF